jgi:lipopolysaccharide transport system ATP-binding protein
MSEVLVNAANVSKKFCRGLKRSLLYGIKDIAGDLLGRNAKTRELRTDEFWAVKDVSFALSRGECLGLIGRNGAGKTTLLRTLNGLIKPDAGSITMRGRVGALIALGAGFNPVLTGRENIYVNASVLGLGRHEIDGQIDEIIDFAEIQEFIDAPVQSYSSGMQVRLGFAIATALKPDILLLDEVLAVGDAGFRAKCYNRLAKIHENAAVIFVSHDMSSVAHICDRVLHFRKGLSTAYEDVMEGIAAYNEDNEDSSGNVEAGSRVMYPPIRDARFSIGAAVLTYGDSLDVRLQLETERALNKPLISFVATNEAGQHVLCWHTNQFDVDFEIPGGLSELQFVVEPLWLHSGRYTCHIMIVEEGSIEHILWLANQATFTVNTGRQPVSGVPLLMPYKGHTVTTIPRLDRSIAEHPSGLRELRPDAASAAIHY